MYHVSCDEKVTFRAERRRREARRETFTTPELVTTRRSILGPPAEGRPGPSDYDDDNDLEYDDEHDDDHEHKHQDHTMKNSIAMMMCIALVLTARLKRENCCN